MLEVTVVGPGFWRPRVDRALGRLEPRVRPLARAFLQYLHGRHVGITPDLAVAIARAMTSPDDSWAGDARGRLAYALIGQGLSAKGVGGQAAVGAAALGAGRASRIAGDAAGSATPFYTAARLVLPTLANAIDAIGRTVLFGADGHGEGPDVAKTYDTYAKALLRALQGEVKTRGNLMGRGHEVASARLVALAERGQGGAQTIPMIDHGTLALVEAIARRFPGSRGLTGRKAWPVRQHGPRGGERPPQDGVSGLRVSRRESDLVDIAAGELANDPLLMLERIVNAGFFVRHRPPRVLPERQLLVIGLMPHRMAGTGGRVFKAAWIAATSKVAEGLAGAGLAASDLLWLEADGLEGFQAAGLAVDSISQRAGDGYDPIDAWLGHMIDLRAGNRIDASLVAGLDGVNALSAALRRAILGGLDRLVRDQAMGAERVRRRSASGVMVGERSGVADAPTRAPSDYGAVAALVAIPDGIDPSVSSPGLMATTLQGILGGQPSLLFVRVPEDARAIDRWAIGRDPRNWAPLARSATLTAVDEGAVDAAEVDVVGEAAQVLAARWRLTINEALDGRRSALSA